MLVLIYWSWCHQLGGGGKGGKGPPVKYTASSILRRTNSSSASSYYTVHELAPFGWMKLNPEGIIRVWTLSTRQKITLFLKKKVCISKKAPHSNVRGWDTFQLLSADSESALLMVTCKKEADDQFSSDGLPLVGKKPVHIKPRFLDTFQYWFTLLCWNLIL